jgi:hypothetical protein
MPLILDVMVGFFTARGRLESPFMSDLSTSVTWLPTGVARDMLFSSCECTDVDEAEVAEESCIGAGFTGVEELGGDDGCDMTC